MMIISEEEHFKLYKALSNPIMDLRLDALNKVFSPGLWDEKLFELETLLYTSVRQALDLHRIGDPETYTEEAPTEPGYYWIDCFLEEEPYIVQVIVRPGHSYLAIEDVLWTGKRNFTAVKQMSAKWAGPIQMPTKNSEESVDGT